MYNVWRDAIRLHGIRGRRGGIGGGHRDRTGKHPRCGRWNVGRQPQVCARLPYRAICTSFLHLMYLALVSIFLLALLIQILALMMVRFL